MRFFCGNLMLGSKFDLDLDDTHLSFSRLRFLCLSLPVYLSFFLFLCLSFSVTFTLRFFAALYLFLVYLSLIFYYLIFFLCITFDLDLFHIHPSLSRLIVFFFFVSACVSLLFSSLGFSFSFAVFLSRSYLLSLSL